VVLLMKDVKMGEDKDLKRQVKIDKGDFQNVTYKGIKLEIILNKILQDGTVILSEEDKKYSERIRIEDPKERGRKDCIVTVLEKDKIALIFQREYFNKHAGAYNCERRGFSTIPVSYTAENQRGRRNTFWFWKVVEDLRGKSWLSKIKDKLFSKNYFWPGTDLGLKYIFRGVCEKGVSGWSTRQTINEIGVVDDKGPASFGEGGFNYLHLDGSFDDPALNENWIKERGLDKILDRYVDN